MLSMFVPKPNPDFTGGRAHCHPGASSALFAGWIHQGSASLVDVRVCVLLLIVQRPSEEHYVWFWTVDCVVHPTPGLLDTHASPLCFRKQPSLGQQLRHFRRQDDVPARPFVPLGSQHVVSFVSLAPSSHASVRSSHLYS